MARSKEQGGASTRDRLIALLRRGQRTVEELAAALGRTDNAVRAQLEGLRREGVARAAAVRRDGTVGKPAVLYDIEPAAEPAFSAAYAPVLAALLAELRDRPAPADVETALRNVGRRLAAEPGLAPSAAAGTLDARARQALAVFGALGAEADLEQTPDGLMIRGYACPLSAAVHVEPKVCAAVEELVGSIVGAPVRECCDRADRPRCRFQITTPAA